MGSTRVEDYRVITVKDYERFLNMEKALQALTDNIDNWLETGESTSKEISKELYENAKEALKK